MLTKIAQNIPLEVVCKLDTCDYELISHMQNSDFYALKTPKMLKYAMKNKNFT